MLLKHSTPRCGRGYRFLICFLIFWGLLCTYAMRVIVSPVIGALAEEYGYSSSEKGLILAAFFIGYLLLQIVGGWLADRHGGAVILLGGILAGSLVTALTPLAAHSLPALVAMRILAGACSSPLYPSVHALASKWAPKDEISSFLLCAWSGGYIGTAIVLPIAGILTVTPGWGWRSLFYLVGAMGAVWSLAWMLLATSAPEDNSCVSLQEKQQIVRERAGAASSSSSSSSSSSQSLAAGAAAGAEDDGSNAKDTDRILTSGAGAGAAAPARGTVSGSSSAGSVPWLRVLSHPAVIAIAVAHTTHNWQYYLLLTWLPEFLRLQLGYDVKQSGIVAVAPYLCCFLLSISAGLIADRLIMSLRKVVVRKTAQTIGEVLPAIMLVASGYCTSAPAAVALLSLSVGFSGVSGAGFGANHIDLAPRLSGVLMALGNTAATLPGIIAPIVVGEMVAAPHDDIEHWRGVFWMSGAICILGWMVYMWLGRAELQPELQGQEPSLLLSSSGAAAAASSAGSAGKKGEKEKESQHFQDTYVEEDGSSSMSRQQSSQESAFLIAAPGSGNSSGVAVKRAVSSGTQQDSSSSSNQL